jgi:transcriptional regulator with XRE-family HTH domain
VAVDREPIRKLALGTAFGHILAPGTPAGRAVPVLEIGPKLRAIRTQRRLSVRSLAGRTGFSASFISQVELGQSSPSLASLQKICAALDLDLVDLLGEKSGRGGTALVRRRDRDVLRSEWSRVTAELLVPDPSDGRLSAMLLAFDPKGRTGPMERRRGARHFAYCIRGRVKVNAGEVYELGRGDSLLLDAGPPWTWQNIGASAAEVLLLVTRSG